MALLDNLELFSNMEDDTSTTVVENTGNYTLTKQSSGNPVEGTGKVGDGQVFTADYITSDFNANTTLGTGDFTIACWFKVPSDNSRRTFVGMNTSGAFENFVTLDAGDDGDSNAIRGQFRDGSSGEATLSATGFQDDAWHLAILTRTSTTAVLYIDNSQEDTATNAEIGVDVGAVMQIGRLNNTNDCTGSIDEVGIWSKVLSSAERSKLWNSGDGLAYPFTVEEAVANNYAFFM